MTRENKETFKKMLNKFRTNVYCHGRNFDEINKKENGERLNEKNFVLTNKMIELLTDIFDKGITQNSINKFKKLDTQFE